jgi:hypothetical protein
MLQPIQDVSMLFWQPLLSIMPLNITNYSKKFRKRNKEENPDYVPLNIACVFSPPAEGNKDIQQIQEDLTRERRQQTKS